MEHRRPLDQHDASTSSQQSSEDILSRYQDLEIAASASRGRSDMHDYMRHFTSAQTLVADPLERFRTADKDEAPFCIIERHALDAAGILEAAVMPATTRVRADIPIFGTPSSKSARDGSLHERPKSEGVKSKHLRFRAQGAPLGFAEPQPRCPGSRSLP